MRTTIRSYIKGSIYDHLSEYQPLDTFKGELVGRKTDDELIAEELVKAEREKKERELLETQLKLPPSKRSQELMRKYNLSVVTDSSLIDNYSTNVSAGQPVSYEVYYPEDIAVKNLRPTNHLVAIEKVYDSNGDEFNFYFHVSISEPTPGTFNYKVDGMDTYVDKEYKLLSKGSFDLYKALYFYKMKDNSYRDQIVRVFKKYGIMPNSSNVLFGPGSQVDLKIRGLGMRITHTPLNVPIKQEPVIIEDDPVVEPLVEPAEELPALEPTVEPIEEEPPVEAIEEEPIEVSMVSPPLDNLDLPNNVKEFWKDELNLKGGIPFVLKGRLKPRIFKDKFLSVNNIYIGKLYNDKTKKNIKDGRLITGLNSYMVIGSLYGSNIGWDNLKAAIAESNLEFSLDKEKKSVTNKLVEKFIEHLANKTKNKLS